MDYEELVKVYEQLDSTTKRLEKTYYISELLKKTSAKDIEQIILLLQGKVFPSFDDQKIGFASKMMLKAINTATGTDSKKIESEWKRLGDLGKVAEVLTTNKQQATLFSQKLTVEKVFNNIRKLSTLEGQGTVSNKVQLVSELLSSATPKEAIYITRTVLEDLRVGAGEGSLRDAITWAFFPKVIGIFYKCDCGTINPSTTKCIECDKKLITKFKEELANDYKGKILEITKLEDVYTDNITGFEFVKSEDEKLARQVYDYFSSLIQEAYDATNDFAKVAHYVKEKGRKGLLSLNIEPDTPIKVMLAIKAKDVSDGFERVGVPCALEFKYDGFRIQIHKNGKKISLYTRRLENVTKQFPDVVEYVKRHIKGESFILDSEAVGFDPKTGKYRPFQQISQRIRRKYDVEKVAKELPVELNIFDVMYYDGDSYLKVPYKERRALLEKAVKQEKRLVVLSEQIIVKAENEAELFYNRSLDAGNEGIMLKSLDAPYKPGSRVGHMVKLKPTMEPLDLVIVGAEWGEGKRSEWLSSFTLACVDSHSGEFLEIGKVGTGVKEKEEEGLSFEELTNLLKPLIIAEKGKTVKIKPEIVIEIKYEEIQQSPSYSSGYALRFPRVIRLRPDRTQDEVSDLDLVEEFYHAQ